MGGPIYVKLFLVLLAYLIGGIPWAYIVVKLAKGIDVRSIGSGNVGATNAFRAGGTAVGILVGILDISKGALPTYITLHYFGQNWAVFAAFATMIGHSFTPYLGFRGGKGVATSVGAFAVIVPKAVILGVLVWIIIVLTLRIVSVASMVAVVAATVYGVIVPNEPLVKFTLLVVSLVILVRHRSNVKRLLQGKEPKVLIKRQR